MKTKALTAAVTAALMLTTGAVQADLEPRPGDLQLVYSIYLGGVRVLDAQAHLGYEPEQYRIGVKAQTDGFLGQVANWRADVASYGSLAPGGLPRPELYRSISAWRDRPRNTTVEYGTDGAPNVTIAEPPPTEDREPVPDNLKPGTVDPMTAVVVALHAAAEGRGCGGTVPVYDGRQRFDLVWATKGQETLAPSDLSAFSGQAIACTLDYEPVAGRWRQDRQRRDRDDEGRRQRDTNVTIWLGEAGDGRPPVPVRLEADTNLGKLVVHLSKVDRVTEASVGQLPAGNLAASD